MAGRSAKTRFALLPAMTTQLQGEGATSPDHEGRE
jgi:hypothetical protein